MSATEGLRFLIFGHDTVECSYYPKALPGCSLDFDQLGALRESLRLDKQREAREVELCGELFLLQPYGASTGYTRRWRREFFLLTTLLRPERRS
jgi:hypothetical protein